MGIVNAVDIIPRLTPGSVKQLADDLVVCARESYADLDEDVSAYLDRLTTLWAPRMRSGSVPCASGEVAPTGDAPTAIEQGQAQVSSILKRFSSTATGLITSQGDRVRRHSTPAAMASEGVESESKAEPDADGPIDSIPRAVSDQISVEGMDTRILETMEFDTLWVPGGPESIKLAWYGDPTKPWQVHDGVGAMCTEEVKGKIGNTFQLKVDHGICGDPCPNRRKKLFVLVEVTKEQELFCPGSVVWIYRYRGSLQAAIVPCDMPPLRRIRCDKRFMLDHGKLAYHQALLHVRASRAAQRTANWQSFAEAGEICPCCHSVFDWQSTTKSRKQRWLWMTNCRACGAVVCTNCASSRRASQEFGILSAARICDTCVWSGPDGGAGLRRLPELFASISKDSCT